MGANGFLLSVGMANEGSANKRVDDKTEKLSVG